MHIFSENAQYYVKNAAKPYLKSKKYSKNFEIYKKIHTFAANLE